MPVKINDFPQKNKYLPYDLIAAALGLFLFLLLVVTARYSVGMSDEAYYYSVPHRLLLGEHMIADEWELAQLVNLFNLLPNLVYIKLTGSPEGLILFMR